jgi:hypothetical protein
MGVLLQAMESRTQCYMFEMADFVAIVNELGVVDWFSIFSGLGMDCCVDWFCEIVWSCIEKHVSTRFFLGDRKLPWITRFLNNK